MARSTLPTLFLLGLLLFSILPAPADASHNTVQPGDRVSTSRGSCTLNFVFDGTGSLNGRVFIGTAAHCVRSIGDPVGFAGHSNAGTVFYLGDVPNSLNGDGRGDNGIPGHQLDFALIEVASWVVVDPEVEGHPGMPKGTATQSETGFGHRVLFSGHGMGFGLTAPTREDRQGILRGDNARSFSAYGPVISGDSGGPVLHQNGEALGIVSGIGTNGAVGPTVAGVVAELNAVGVPVQLRTV